jgi:hypothetical protein
MRKIFFSFLSVQKRCFYLIYLTRTYITDLNFLIKADYYDNFPLWLIFKSIEKKIKKTMQLWTDILSWVAASETAQLKPTASWAFASATQVRPKILVPDYIHCNKNPIYIFLFWKLRGLSPNFHIHVSVSDLHIYRVRGVLSPDF